LNVLSETMSSLIKEVEFAPPSLSVDEYFKFLLASQKIGETIEILEGIIKETQSVTSIT
jgi:hypothetical protein